jgi:hypothetical protein
MLDGVTLESLKFDSAPIFKPLRSTLAASFETSHCDPRSRHPHDPDFNPKQPLAPKIRGDVPVAPQELARRRRGVCAVGGRDTGRISGFSNPVGER